MVNFPTQAPSQASEQGFRARLEKFGLRSTAYLNISDFRQLCKKWQTFQQRPQAKPQGKAAGPNWKNEGSGPEPMWQYLVRDSSANGCRDDSNQGQIWIRTNLEPAEMKVGFPKWKVGLFLVVPIQITVSPEAGPVRINPRFSGFKLGFIPEHQG